MDSNVQNSNCILIWNACSDDLEYKGPDHQGQPSAPTEREA